MKCRNAQMHFADLIDGVSGPAERREAEEHLRSCASCAREFAGMSAFLSRLTTEAREKPAWTPPDSYWSTLLPRIHERIDERLAKRASPAEAAFLWLRRLALPAAAIVLALLFLTTFPTGTGGNDQDVAALVRQLQPDELNRIIDRQQVEGIFDAPPAFDSNNDLFSVDDRDEIAQLIYDEGPAATSVDAAAPESDGITLASNDDVFDAIAPELEKTVQYH